MEIDKARTLLAELSEIADGLLDEKYVEAIGVVLDDHAKLAEARASRTGKRERQVMDYMATVPGVPMTPAGVQAALELDYTPAAAMANLADKGRLDRFGDKALYRYVPAEQRR